RLTVSIGIAAAPIDGAQRVTLLKAADEALYRAKLGGRNRVVGREGWNSPDLAKDQPAAVRTKAKGA
ncbi:MAG TPA: diguanylate cyclase, partial [Candidatus Limnocylindrales bacterium]